MNFKEFKLFTTLEESQVVDVRKTYADFIYQQGTGIEALELALDIKKSDGEMELSDEQQKLILDLLESKGAQPIFIYSFKENMKK